MADEDSGAGEAEFDETLSEEDAQRLLSATDRQSTDGETDGNTEARFTQADVDRIVRSRAEQIAKKKYADYGDLKKKVAQTKTLEERLSAAEQSLSEREAREIERNGRHALAQVQIRLAEAGIKRDDVAGLLEMVQPTQLLADGEPDDKAIAKFADSLAKVAGRATPDPDQGRKGGQAAPDMNTLIRRAAGVSNH